jgi:cytochrome b561
MSRYHPLLVILHWLSALLVFTTFLLGMFALAHQPNTQEKVVPLAVHMTLGLGILLVTVLRFVVRRITLKPLRKVKNLLAKKKPLIVTLAGPVQYLLYLFTFLMSLTGVGLTLQAGVLTPSGLVLPTDFYDFPLRTVHGTLSTALFVLIVLHLLTWIYFQFLRGENALAWMWFNSNKNQLGK